MNTTPFINTLPEFISIKKHADQGYQWQGEFHLSNFKRLVDTITQTVGTLADLSISLKRQGGIIWFEFILNAQTQVQCQRCLKPMDFPLNKHIKVALLESEEQISLMKDDVEWLLLEEVVEQQEHEDQLPIIDIIEDELLLCLPLAPKHEPNHQDCLPVSIIEEEYEEEIEEEKENPFAILQQLKN